MWLRLLNGLIRGDAAADLVGMPMAHTHAFRAVAMTERCVISSRELGRVCTMLVAEGYDSKGFRIKSKSCNFGPMAGFVCRNPLYSKKGAAYAETQEKDTLKALKDKDHVGWRANVEQICLSEARVQWLRTTVATGGAMYINARPFANDPNVMVGTFTPPGGAKTVYLLRRELRNGDRVWALYTTVQPVDTTPVLERTAFDNLSPVPVEALVNPYPAYPVGHYKNCVTGDYDLFGVWPRVAEYEPRGEDRRIAGMGAGGNAQIIAWEDQKLGNLSNRVHLVGQLINSRLPAAPGAIGGTREMVHHSDEGGRPFVTEIELPVVAFVPLPNGMIEMVGIDSVAGMRTFVQLCRTIGFQPILNPGWRGVLGPFAAFGDVGDARGWQTPLNDPGRGR
jgi:hypothetical protein